MENKLNMDFEKELNRIIPKEFGTKMNPELLTGCIKVCQLSNLIAIQEYLLSRGANDEEINTKIKELRS